ncbi:MAG: FmdB family transcriptional regulator [Leifsonia sp.]|nr:FmdB family transcriptional regulator [Leifsonia sp.]
MPTYSYRCTECSTAFDIQQAFTDDSLTECPTCEGRLRKVFSSIGVTFNGSGFYRTDSRAAERSGSTGGSGSGGSGSGSSGSKDSGSSGSGSGTKESSSSSTPAKKETASSGASTSTSAAAAS